MAVEYKDYYSILGVSEDVDEKTIRQAYRKLARKLHPDVNPGDKAAEERFKEINEANEVLSDPEKRRKYDEMRRYRQQYGRWPGEERQKAAAGRGADRFRGGSYEYRTINEEDLEDLFGGQSPFSSFFETYFHSGFPPGSERRARGGPATFRERQPTRGQDVEAEVEVTLAEAYQGARRTLELSAPDGTTRRLEVTIPAGVDEGSRIRLAGQGGPGAAARGDLYMRVHLLPDARFTRDGADLRTIIEVPLAVTMLGGEAHVPTPDGRSLLLRIPSPTQNGRTFRLRGQGMPQRIGRTDERGDLYAEAKVMLPTQFNDEQRRLFEAFARSVGYTGPATPAGTGGRHA
ncbi:MAG TPA: DnaJ C-terminal domain-containing protein [Ktedonobacterales bacterium]|nr:DnaJ C-terminal domain-containing protein [Ktedonobacterales bacterium]